MKEKFLPTYKTGWVFWPGANMLNFVLVPQNNRVLFANAAGLVWNTILSYINSTPEVTAAPWQGSHPSKAT